MIILHLLKADLSEIVNWFRKQTFSRIFVLISFLIVFSFVSFGIYYFSVDFFSMLSSFEIYGLITAEYLFHVAILMLGFFIVGMGIISNLTFLFTLNHQLDYLVTLPIKIRDIIIWLFIRSSVFNLTLLLIALLPVSFAFVSVFMTSSISVFISRYILILIFFTIITNSIASIISLFLVPFVKGKGIFAAIAGGIFFVIWATLILKIIFPKKILMLSQAEPSQFLSIFHSLPLYNSFFPTFWLTDNIISGKWNYMLYSAIFTVLLFLFALYFSTKRFLEIYHFLKVNTNVVNSKRNFVSDKRLIKTNWPVTYKDFLSIIRMPSEIGYGLFIVSMGLFFFMLFSISKNTRIEKNMWESQLIIFSFVWFIFFITAYLLRLVFPLMAKEGKHAWYIFTIPLARNKIIFSKLLLGAVLSTPYLIMAFIIWYLLPFGNKYFWQFGIISAYLVITLTLMQVIMGAIFPNFSSEENSEKVSTSVMGIITFFISFFIMAVTSVIIYQLLQGTRNFIAGFIIIAALGIVFNMIILSIANSRINRYEF